MDTFEELLARDRAAIERFVRFRIQNRADADDILQEVSITAYQKLDQLKNRDAFKPWILAIARNTCTDYYRARAVQTEVSLDALAESAWCGSCHGMHAIDIVQETLHVLREQDREILHLYFWQQLPQAEIARRLHIPIGTVKSRLYTAKQRFRAHYPYPHTQNKGESTMKTLPKYLPSYTIVPREEIPFSVKWEELMGWFIVPRLGEKLRWAMYDMPSRRIGEIDRMEVVGKAIVHGIEGMEIQVQTTAPMDCNSEGGQSFVSRTFVAQLTDTHCRYLAESHVRDGVRHMYTFLDGESFLNNWGFGEDNCGNAIHLAPKGDIQRDGTTITSIDAPFLLDIVGRYTVTIGGKSYDTVCVMDIETYNGGVVSEQYLDSHGRTILWRRFNRDDWALHRYGKRWSEQLPQNERRIVNGTTYVHWYDCITDYIL